MLVCPSVCLWWPFFFFLTPFFKGIALTLSITSLSLSLWWKSTCCVLVALLWGMREESHDRYRPSLCLLIPLDGSSSSVCSGTGLLCSPQKFKTSWLKLSFGDIDFLTFSCCYPDTQERLHRKDYFCNNKKTNCLHQHVVVRTRYTFGSV